MKHLSMKIVAVMSAFSVLLGIFCINPAYAVADEESALGASAACAGHVLGTFSGVPACVNKNGDLHICANNFLDEFFMDYVADMQGAEDGYFTQDESEQIKSIGFSEKSAYSLQGVEFFTALVSLNCSSNQLKQLDVSNNTALEELYLSYNQLAELDTSNNTALKYLKCDCNHLTKLDIRGSTALISLDCGYNQLTELDVSNNTALEVLRCNNNQLKELNVSKNTVLDGLYCWNNQLKSLDVTNCPDLGYLDCSKNNMTELFTNKWDGKWTLLEVSPQTSTLPLVKSGNVWTADLSSLVANKDNLTRIDPESFSEGAFNWNTGVVTFTEKPTFFAYECYIGKVQKQMKVTVHLTESETTCKATINGVEYQYAAGEQVALTADAFYLDGNWGYRFDRWTGDVDTVADVDANTTTFTMPDRDVTITSTYYLIGDVDGNGVVDVMDAAAIIRMASGRQTPTPAGDITGTGVVDAMSAANIARYIVGSYIPTK